MEPKAGQFWRSEGTFARVVSVGRVYVTFHERGEKKAPWVGPSRMTIKRFATEFRYMKG